MKFRSILILAFIAAIFLIFNMSVNCQTVKQIDSISIFEKARYPKEDLTKFLIKQTVYPKEAIINDIQGDVVLSFIVKKNGKLDSLSVMSSSNSSLSAWSLVAFTSIEGNWIPCKINNTPIDKKYIVVFRFRRYLNIQPPAYESNAEKYFKDKKYEKALKLYDKAIKDNEYASQLFKARSVVKKILGDEAGSQQDHIRSINLQQEIMSVVDIIVRGSTNVVTIKGPITKY